MRFDDFCVKDMGCHIVFGGTKEDRDAFEKEFLSRNEDFCYKMPDNIYYDKKGLFAPKLLLKRLVKNAPKHKQKELESQLKKEGSRTYRGWDLQRAAKTLSAKQKLFWSLVFYALCQNKKFYIRNENSPMDVPCALEIVGWLRYHFGKENVQIVYVTGEPEENFTEPVFAENLRSSYKIDAYNNYIRGNCTKLVCDTLYSVTDGHKDKEEFFESLSQKKLKGKLEQLSNVRDIFKTAKKYEKEGKSQKAIEFYEKIIKMEQDGLFAQDREIYKDFRSYEVPEAMFSCSKLYYNTAISGDGDAIERSVRLRFSAGEDYRYVPALIYLGDKEMESFDKEKFGKLADENKFRCVKNATKYYRMAAQKGSAEAAYKAAKLCYQYTLTSKWDGQVDFTQGRADAAEFVEILTKLSCDGDKDASKYLDLLRIYQI